MHQFSNGRHQYKGAFNGSGKRKQSKLYKGVKVNRKALKIAFIKIEKERVYDNKRRLQKGRNRLARKALPER